MLSRIFVNKSSKQLGFTIVELIIVIVVIGILSAIAIVGFNGIKNKAQVAALQSDLNAAFKTIQVDNAKTGSFPSSAATANGGSGLKGSPGTIYTYTYISAVNAFCLVASNSLTTYYISSMNSTPVEGLSCPFSGIASTYAGNGLPYEIDGTGTGASFSYPQRIVAAADGTLYVVDTQANVVRKVTTSAVVTTFAGSGGAPAFADGTGTAASFSLPSGLAITSDGTIYIADNGNNRIRKITQAGVVTTVAGSATAGSADGTGAAARFSCPTDVAVGPDDTLYVADACNNTIRKVTPAGVVTTIAGIPNVIGVNDGPCATARFNAASGIVMARDGSLYIADTNNHLIRKIDTSCTVTTLAGSTAGFADATGSAAQFSRPRGVAVGGDNNIYVADTGNNRVRRISPNGVVTTLVGSGIAGFADGIGTAGTQFNEPTGLAVYANNTLYVTDMSNFRIRKVQ